MATVSPLRLIVCSQVSSLTASSSCSTDIFLAEDYLGSFDDIFKKHGLPNDLSIYVHCPSELDPTCAPEGKETLTVLVVRPVLLEPFLFLRAPR